MASHPSHFGWLSIVLFSQQHCLVVEFLLPPRDDYLTRFSQCCRFDSGYVLFRQSRYSKGHCQTCLKDFRKQIPPSSTRYEFPRIRDVRGSPSRCSSHAVGGKLRGNPKCAFPKRIILSTSSFSIVHASPICYFSDNLSHGKWLLVSAFCGHPRHVVHCSCCSPSL